MPTAPASNRIFAATAVRESLTSRFFQNKFKIIESFVVGLGHNAGFRYSHIVAVTSHCTWASDSGVNKAA